MYVSDTGLSLAPQDPGIPFFGEPGAEKDKKRGIFAPVAVNCGKPENGAWEHGGIVPDHFFCFPFTDGIGIAGVRWTQFIQQVVRILIESAGCQGTGEYEAFDVQVLRQFEHVPGTINIRMLVLGIIIHCEIIVTGKVQDIIGTAIPVNAFNDILQVGEIAYVHLGPANVMMLGYARFLLGSSSQAKKPVPVGIQFDKMLPDKT